MVGMRPHCIGDLIVSAYLTVDLCPYCTGVFSCIVPVLYSQMITIIMPYPY